MLGEAAPGEEIGIRAIGCDPVAGRYGEATAEQQFLAVLFNPIGESRPFPEQGFMGDLDCCAPGHFVVVERQQAVAAERIQD